MTPAHFDTWQLQEAKNRFSAVIDAVEAGQDQVVTRHGEPVAVVVPYATWQRWHDRRVQEAPSLYQALRSAATEGGLPQELDLDRERPVDRPVPDFG